MGTKSLAVTLSCFLLIFVISVLLYGSTVWLLCHAISCELLVEEARLMFVVFVHKVTYACLN